MSSANPLQAPKSFRTRTAVVWLLFFMIGLSLGYPTLNRYQPEQASLKDVGYYRQMVEHGVADMPHSHWRCRVLVPYMAKPLYKLAKGRVGSWDPVTLSLLVVNSFFVASAAMLLLSLVRAVSGSTATGLIGSFLFMAHFNVSNLFLSGLVDSAEFFFLTALVWSMFNERWMWLPILGILGGLAKETFMPFSTAFAGGWVAYQFLLGDRRPLPAAMVAALAVTGIVTVFGLRGYVTGQMEMPWDMAADQLSRQMPGAWDLIQENILNRGFAYSFAWLLPLGALGLASVPGRWLAGSAAAVAVALVLSLMAGAGENIGRPLFNTGGLALLCGAAIFLSRCIVDERPLET